MEALHAGELHGTAGQSIRDPVGSAVTPVRSIESLNALYGCVGRELACSDWVAVGQDLIDRFADVTGDRQWIHVDPERAARESPFASTVAHGYLTLSLLPALFASCLRIEGVGAAINYGLDRVRFPAPVLARQRIRARLLLARVVPIEGGVQACWTVTIEVENGVKPACVAEVLTRYYAKPAAVTAQNGAGDVPHRSELAACERRPA